MAAYELTFDVSGIQVALERAADMLIPELMGASPTGKGDSGQKLVESFDRRIEGTRLVITNDAPQYKYVRYGTAPHTIEAAAGSVLRFEVGGEVVFSRLVHHPGTSPNPFAQGVWDRMSDAVRSELASMVRAAIHVGVA